MKKDKVNDVDISENKVGILTFTMGKEIFGIEMKFVREIMRLDKITTLYRVDPSIAGVINMRGKILPVIDLKSFLKLSKIKLTENSYYKTQKGQNAIIIEFEQKEFVMIVDKIEEVKWVEQSDIREVSTMVKEDLKEYVNEIIKTEHQPVSILNIKKFVNSKRWDKYKA